MPKPNLCAALVAFACALAAASAARGATAHHAVVDRIPGPDGGYDYLAVDAAAQRLFVARAFGVMAVDLQTRALTPRLVQANDVSAVLPIPDSPLMLSTVYGDDKAVIFDRATGAVLAEVATGKSPDAAAYDPFSKLVLVMNAKSADITLVDVAKRAAVGVIALGGKPEAAVSDGRGRIYVNLEDAAEVAVIEMATRKVERRYRLPGCEEPTGIAHDPAAGVLIAACHNRTAKLIDAATGADRGTVTVGKDADGAIFDPARRLVFIPCKEGTLSIFALGADGKPGPVQVVKTAPGARTAALDPTTGRIYLAAQQARLDDKGEEGFVPGTFEILVVAPQ
ncbi:YncE family protein [Phenylobacterium sp.]|uniref:YncE family protein n=1 Tax=Phenylobacterium sp. TaxID=1871053 RepID=UPI002FC8AE06